MLKLVLEMLVKMPIQRLKIRKDGTSEDICKVPKKIQNLPIVLSGKWMNFL
jgi:hypothetical protein